MKWGHFNIWNGSSLLMSIITHFVWNRFLVDNDKNRFCLTTVGSNDVCFFVSFAFSAFSANLFSVTILSYSALWFLFMCEIMFDVPSPLLYANIGVLRLLGWQVPASSLFSFQHIMQQANRDRSNCLPLFIAACTASSVTTRHMSSLQMSDLFPRIFCRGIPSSFNVGMRQASHKMVALDWSVLLVKEVKGRWTSSSSYSSSSESASSSDASSAGRVASCVIRRRGVWEAAIPPFKHYTLMQKVSSKILKYYVYLSNTQIILKYYLNNTWVIWVILEYYSNNTWLNTVETDERSTNNGIFKRLTFGGAPSSSGLEAPRGGDTAVTGASEGSRGAGLRWGSTDSLKLPFCPCPGESSHGQCIFIILLSKSPFVVCDALRCVTSARPFVAWRCYVKWWRCSWRLI